MSETATVRPLPDFGVMPDGTPAKCFELDNGKGLRAHVTTLGGIVLKLFTPDREGHSENVCLYPADIDQVLKGQSPYFGAIIGRVGNRIDHGKFNLDGNAFQITANDGPHALHGGKLGYDKRIWQAVILSGASIRLTLVDDSTHDGFPGVVTVSVVYTLTEAGAWKIEYEATTDAPTPINLTQHAYFNLKDAGKTNVLDHELRIAGYDYTPVDATLMPTGQIKPVEGTPLDFTTAKPIGRDIKQIDAKPQGYDHNFVIAAAPGPLREIAEVYEPVTGRRMIVRTTEPGVQLYTGNFLDGTLVGGDGFAYGQYSGFCLETQHFPNSVNVPNFPSTILRPGDTFHSVTEYQFSAK